MAVLIQVRRATASEWNTVDPVLAEGEFGYEIDTGKLKIGNGVSRWSELPYFSSVTVAGDTGQIQFNQDGNLGADSALYWDIANKRLGIGTSSPLARLHVVDDVYFDKGPVYVLRSDADTYVVVGKTNDPGNRVLLYFDNDQLAGYVGLDGWRGITFKNNKVYVCGVATASYNDADADIMFCVDGGVYVSMKLYNDRSIGICNVLEPADSPESGFVKLWYDTNEEDLKVKRADGSVSYVTRQGLMECRDIVGDADPKKFIVIDEKTADKPRFSSIIYPKIALSVIDKFFPSYKRGIVIPFYKYPWNSSEGTWDGAFLDLIAAIRAISNVPVMVVFNPATGPGTTTDVVYRRAIKMVKAAGGIALGYVDTNYATRDSAEVLNDIGAWRGLYPQIDGIFLDRMTNDSDTTHIDYYANITYETHLKDLFPVVGNAGAIVPSEYFLSNAADIIVIHENTTYPNWTDFEGDWEDSYRELPTWRRAAIVYGQSSIDVDNVKKLQKYCGWFFVTDSTDYSNGIPSFFDGLLWLAQDFELTNKNVDIKLPVRVAKRAVGFELRTIISSSTTIIDWTQGNIWKVSLTQDTTLSFIDPAVSCTLTIVLEQDANGGHTVTWPSNVLWPDGMDGSPTTTPNAKDVITLLFDGTNYFAVGNYNFS